MLVLGGRGAAGYVLGRGAGSASANWWEAGGATNCVAAYQPKGAASLAASYINLANPGTYDAAPGVAPTWDAATGWTFAAASLQFLMTGLTPASDQSWSMIVRFSDIPTDAARPICGSNDGVNRRFAIWPLGQQAPNAAIYQNGGSLIITPNLTSGVMAIAGNAGYRNGVAESGTIAAWGGTATYPIYIGARSGAIVAHGSGKIQAVAIYNATLSAAQVAAISAAMAAL